MRLSDPTVNPEGDLVIEEALTVFRQTLNPPALLVLDLMILGYTDKEIAGKVNKTEVNIRQIRFKIRQNFRKQCKE